LWQPQSWLSIYGNYAESFGPSTGGLTWPDRKLAPPTNAEQWDVGIKTEFFGGRLRATASYYDLTKTNVAAIDPDPLHACRGNIPRTCQTVTGAVHSKGPELDIQDEILPGWNVIATYAYTDMRVAKTNSANDADFATSLRVGDRYWGVPRNKASFWSTYNFLNGALQGFKVGGGVYLQDAQSIHYLPDL